MPAEIDPLRILQVSTYDVGGGAERIAAQLMAYYRAQGHTAEMAVGIKRADDPGTYLIPNAALRGPWTRFWWRVYERMGPVSHRLRGVWRVRRLAEYLAEPGIALDRTRGIQTMRYPGTRRLLDLPPQPPDIVHAHNLHIDYFDLRQLPRLSRQRPLLITLHDMWLFTGHCAHALQGEWWKTGCVHCPDLALYPPIRRDATTINWGRKRDIYAQSRFAIAAPSRWLLDRAQQSMLMPAVSEARVIPNGVDVDTFHPADDVRAIREALGLPPDAAILLFTALGIRSNVWKDYATLEAAVRQIAARIGDRPLVFVVLGESGEDETWDGAAVRYVPFQRDPAVVAQYYQTADLYLHAAYADTFPNTVLEALACGTPVVATAVGGIPEQIRGLAHFDPRWNTSDPAEATGVLVGPGDAPAMAEAALALLADDPLRRQLSENAARDVRARFSLKQQGDTYLAFYRELIARHAADTQRA